MKTFFSSILLVFCCSMARAQDCACPDGINNDNDGKPYKTFRFSNGKELGICGYAAVENNDTSYTMFTLFQCEDKTPVKAWGANQTCQAEQVKDDLFIKEMYGLPIGQSFSTLWRPFYIHRFFYKNGALQEVTSYRKDLPKYSKQQIEQVFEAYKNLSKDSNESTMHVANMLFWAYTSGNKDAEAALKSIPDKFGPFDDVIAGEWKAIFATYENWKEKNITN